jgi:hypothetical protein
MHTIRVLKFSLFVAVFYVLTVSVMSYNLQKIAKYYDSNEESPDWRIFERFLRGGMDSPKLKTCKWQGMQCDPWKDRCCGRMECVNYAKGYCVGLGMERCVCMNTVHTDVDIGK